MSILDKVTRLMTERGLRQTDLAAMMGTSRQRVSLWLDGKAQMKVFHLLKLARGLGVDLDYLVDDEMAEPASGRPTQDEERVLWAMRALNLTADEVLRRLEIAARYMEGNPAPKRPASGPPEVFRQTPEKGGSGSGRGRKLN